MRSYFGFDYYILIYYTERAKAQAENKCAIYIAKPKQKHTNTYTRHTYEYIGDAKLYNVATRNTCDGAVGAQTHV